MCMGLRLAHPPTPTSATPRDLGQIFLDFFFSLLMLCFHIPGLPVKVSSLILVRGLPN